MTREEYLNKLNNLTHQLKMLKDEYITSNNCIPKGNYVIVTYDDKEARYYLKDYKIIDGYIKPILIIVIKMVNEKLLILPERNFLVILL